MTAIIKQGNVAVPRHVAIIMDGNGRWAQSRFLPRAEGHRRGVESVRRTIEAAVKAGVPFLSLLHSALRIGVVLRKKSMR